jgi:hypothetical protein
MTSPLLRREVEPPRRPGAPWLPIVALGTISMLTIAMAMSVATSSPHPGQPHPATMPAPAPAPPQPHAATTATAPAPPQAATPEPALTAAERERLVREAEALIRAARIDIAEHEAWAREHLSRSRSRSASP